MSPFLLDLVLLKATLTSFSGLASLPILRNDLVLNRHVLTDEQLNTAVVVSRTTPGPVGVYVVSVGYAVSGFPGAIAGWGAMCTPALLILPLIHLASGRRPTAACAGPSKQSSPPAPDSCWLLAFRSPAKP